MSEYLLPQGLMSVLIIEFGRTLKLILVISKYLKRIIFYKSHSIKQLLLMYHFGVANIWVSNMENCILNCKVGQ